MRFFRVETLDGKVYVQAEAIGELVGDSETFSGPPDRLTGDVRSEDELLATSVGRRALRRWRSHDDGNLEAALRRRDLERRRADEADLARWESMSTSEIEAIFRREALQRGEDPSELDGLLENLRRPKLSIVE